MINLPFVVFDSSAVLALVLSEPLGSEVDELFRDLVECNGQAHVPALFWFEVGNGLVAAERRNRIDLSQSDAAGRFLSQLPFVTHEAADGDAGRRTIALARKHGLSWYDASYVELMVRLQAPLKSFDKNILGLKDEYPLIL